MMFFSIVVLYEILLSIVLVKFSVVDMFKLVIEFRIDLSVVVLVVGYVCGLFLMNLNWNLKYWLCF